MFPPQLWLIDLIPSLSCTTSISLIILYFHYYFHLTPIHLLIPSILTLSDPFPPPHLSYFIYPRDFTVGWLNIWPSFRVLCISHKALNSSYYHYSSTHSNLIIANVDKSIQICSRVWVTLLTLIDYTGDLLLIRKIYRVLWYT